MAELEVTVQVERRVAATPALAWALAADSNRLDRVLGAGRATYTVEPDGDERVRLGHGKPAGVDASWVEHGEWIEGHFFVAERRYRTGLLRRAGVRLEVTPDGDGARLALRSWTVPVTPPTDGGALMAATIRGALDGYLAGVAALLDGAPGAPADAALPAAVQARRVLAAHAAPPVVAGRRAATDEAQWAFCTQRFAAAPVAPGLRARLLAHLRERADDEVRQLRAFELARAWGERPRDVLAAFLHAARAGLVELRWELACPACRVAAGAATSLAAVAPRTHCVECDVSFESDFARNVEAVFQVSPAIRAIDVRPYCGGSPWWRPHIFARFEVPPGGRRASEVTPPHPLLLRAPRPNAVAAVEGGEGLHVVVEPGGLRVAPAAAGLSVENHTDREIALHVERADVGLATVSGADIMTMPEFLDLFATDAPATGVDLTVGALTILFTDLTDTTSLYERIGDSRAFALVEQHFRRAAAIVAAHGGAVVKTMGDAVMASFRAPDAALGAALALVDDTARGLAGEGVALRAGLHAGPCLAVRANDRLDFFGATVNLAARLQTHARGGEVVLVDELLDHPGVAGEVRARGLALARERAVLKGVREARAVVKLRTASSSRAGS
jgi:class 3 adenylate cyclase